MTLEEIKKLLWWQPVWDGTIHGMTRSPNGDLSFRNMINVSSTVQSAVRFFRFGVTKYEFILDIPEQSVHVEQIGRSPSGGYRTLVMPPRGKWNRSFMKRASGAAWILSLRVQGYLVDCWTGPECWIDLLGKINIGVGGAWKKIPIEHRGRFSGSYQDGGVMGAFPIRPCDACDQEICFNFPSPRPYSAVDQFTQDPHSFFLSLARHDNQIGL